MTSYVFNVASFFVVIWEFLSLPPFIAPQSIAMPISKAKILELRAFLVRRGLQAPSHLRCAGKCNWLTKYAGDSVRRVANAIT